MKSKSTKNLLTIILLLASIGLTSAQNKDVDKGKETLNKAMQQTDNMKRQDLINKARESFQKGGLKTPDIAVLIGEAYLSKNMLKEAETAYGSASKEAKKEGLKKVAEALVEQAFTEDDKAQAKTLAKATSLFAKADASKEGARMIGDKFYEKGESGYSQAINYYVTGDAAVKVEQIAKEYFEKGGDNEAKAADAYAKLKSPEGYKKAGDIYYDRKEYKKAIDNYMAGGVSEGIQKYANYLYNDHRDDEANDLIMKLADTYAEKKNDEALEKLANDVMAKGGYAMAAKIYDKAGNTTARDKALAYDALVGLRLDEAKGLFNSIPDAASAKMITDNQKTLTTLHDIGETLDQLMKNAPPVNWMLDSVTGKNYPSVSDQQMQEDYYKSIRDQVIKNVNDVALNYPKLTSADVKKYVRERFLKYGAVRNILDKDTFLVKKQKQDIKAKDVIL